MSKIQLAASGEPDISSNYAGVAAAGYVSAATLTGTSIANGHVTLHQNVPYKLNVRNLSLGGSIIQAGACDFSHSGTVDLSDTVLTVADFMINMDMCKKEFMTHWERQSMGNSRAGASMPSEFLRAYILELQKYLSWNIQRNLWDGNSGLAGAPTDFNGFTKIIFDANGSDWDVDGTVTMSATTVLAEIRKVIAAVPDAVKAAPDFKIFVSRAIADFYVQSLGNSHYLDMASVGDKPLNVDGYNLTVADGMNAQVMIAARTGDLHYGTWLQNDAQSVQVIDMRPIEGSDNVRFVMRWQSGCQITNIVDIVSYLNVPA